MDSEVISELLKAIRDAVSTTHQKDDDIALPLFDPDKNDCGAKNWCCSIETLASELKWSSIKTAAKAGKALKGSALTWFESWEPSEGRSWEKFHADIIDAFPERKNLSEKLSKAVLYNSDSADSNGEYAREKLRTCNQIPSRLLRDEVAYMTTRATAWRPPYDATHVFLRKPAQDASGPDNKPRRADKRAWRASVAAQFKPYA
ncbi:unnamed protein product [Arctia plantaginis]|uniref:Retrotransposon gag domain-containing protein n=1 Tax=Arctia plantaginis TaxID=874455 RepID=A0A8S1B7Q7_ARCPL|nr:unnamed protein product [Arctia plantaginis]